MMERLVWRLRALRCWITKHDPGPLIEFSGVTRWTDITHAVICGRCDAVLWWAGTERDTRDPDRRSWDAEKTGDKA